MTAPAVGATDAPPKASPLKILLRFAIGLAVIAILLWRIGPSGRHDLAHGLASTNPGWVIGAGVLFAIGLVVSAFRWQAYLDVLDLPVAISSVIRLYFVGQFFNSFLPSGVGGDAYKAVRLGKGRGKIPEAVASTFLDRFAGFVALSVIGVAGAAYAFAVRVRPLVVVEVGAGLSVAMLLAAAALLLLGDRIARLFPERGIGGKVRTAVAAIHAAGRHRAAATRGYLWGLVYQAFVVGYHYVLLRALGLRGVSLAALTSIVVIGSLATLLPSPGGIGFRDAAYVWAFTRFGVLHGTALLFALLVDAILLATSAIGFVVYVIAGGDVALAR